MGHVFISYSRRDQAHARRLTEDLRQHGFDVWIDDRIDYGERWLSVIFQAIRDASAVVVIMSPDSEKSKWVEKEYLYAEELGKLVLPLRLQGPLFPYFVNVQVGNFTEDGGLPDDFYDRLQRVVMPKDGTGKIIVAPVLPETAEKKTASAKSHKSRVVGILVGVITLVIVSGLLLSGVLGGDDEKGRGDTNKGTDQPSEAITHTSAQSIPLSTETPSSVTTPTASSTRTPDPNSAATPNGGGTGEIAYASYSYDEQDWGIYVMKWDGGKPIRLTQNSSQDDDPEWSPDGSQIVFTSTREGDMEIYVMNVDGNNLMNLTQTEGIDDSPAWSPDGTKIAFSSFRDGNAEIYVMNADGSEPIRLTQNEAHDREPAWSPDGTQLAFISERDGIWEIYVMNADGSEPTRLTQIEGVEWTPAWSPDGTKIAFMSNRDGNQEIYIMDANGIGVMNLTQNAAHDYGPAWSPDGTQIAFVSDRDKSSWEIYVMNADGTNQQNITNSPYSNEAYPAWRPALR